MTASISPISRCVFLPSSFRLAAYNMWSSGAQKGVRRDHCAPRLQAYRQAMLTQQKAVRLLNSFFRPLKASPHFTPFIFNLIVSTGAFPDIDWSSAIN